MLSIFAPTGFDEGIFNAVTKLLHEKVEQAKRSGSDNAKTVNTIECDNFCNFFKIPEQLYDAAFTQVISESTPKVLGKETDWLPARYTPSEYLNCGNGSSQVFTINKGMAQGTTFKIDTGGFAFSCLFDSGAEISCMNMDTVAALGLLGKLTQSSVTVNMASGQNMGMAGDVPVNFKIGRKYSFTQKFVVYENLTRPFILGANFMSKYYMKLGWAPGKKRTLGYLDETIAVASQEVTNEPLFLRNSIRIPARNCAVVPVYCAQMFSGKVMAIPCEELK